MISREDAIAQLKAAGHPADLVETALDLCGSLELAEYLLKTGDVTPEGRAKLKVGPPKMVTLDHEESIRALKYVFDDRAAVTRLKEGKTVLLCLLDDDKREYYDFTPKDADDCLKHLCKKTLEEWNPADPFFPDRQPLVPPRPKRERPPPVAPRAVPQLAPNVPQQPQPVAPVVVEDPFVTELRRTQGHLFDALNGRQQEVIVRLMKGHGCTIELALEQAIDADWDADFADAMLTSLEVDGHEEAEKAAGSPDAA
jgi:hypothetical protein